jgi:hypothetical protein
LVTPAAAVSVLPATFADPVEDDHGVVDRVPDDGQQRGEEHAVEGLAEPGEQADQQGASWTMPATAAVP